MRQALLERSPEVWRIACQEMARRAQGGTVLYPAAIALLGLGADLHRTSPGALAAILGFAYLLGLGRLFLIRRFDFTYSRSPRLWQAGFFGGALATGALYSGLLCFLTVKRGLAPFAVFALAATLGLAAMVAVTYFHSLPVVLSYILLLGVPPTVALARLAGTDPAALWLALSNAGATCYVLWIGWQQHHERWASLGKRYQLELRAAELERAHVEVEQARAELELLVAERTRALEPAIISIDRDVTGQLFELFSQGDGSTSRRFGGTGLGLAISKRIVEAMGGEIGFESLRAKGSTFWFLVPLAPSAPPAQTESAVGRPVSARILTVEDNPINQIVITEQLKHLGYQVTAVGNGLEALEALAVEEFDLVLMDCQMPHLDGYEATERIRRMPGKVGQIPIVALTAHAIREELDRCLEVGMNDYITKPFRGEVLQSKLERWLGSEVRGRRDELDGSQSEPADPAETALDQQQLESLRAMCQDSGPGFVAGLVEQFRRQPYLEDIRTALERGDRALLKARAHGLKGTSSLLGARGLPRLCEQLERSCMLASREECLRQIEQIDAEHRRFVVRLAENLP